VNSQPPRWRLPSSHQDLLRRALEGGASESIVTPELRGAIRGICSTPERHRFEPEDFLIAFKLALVNAANDVGIAPGPDRNDFLSKLVTVYIEEFYRSPGAGADGDGIEKSNGRGQGAKDALRAVTNSDVAHTLSDAQPSA
jgi:hypothetical protein